MISIGPFAVMPLAVSVTKVAKPLRLWLLLELRREWLDREVPVCWLGAFVLWDEGGPLAEMVSFPSPFPCVWTQPIPAVLHELQVQVVWWEGGD